MSVGIAETRQLGSKLAPSNNVPVYERPSEWPALTPISTTESKVTGLVAIFPDDKVNVLSFTMTVSSGTYTIDWGDGGATEAVASATQANHQYTYSSIAGSPTSYGYKIVTVTITPTSGAANFTAIDLRKRPPTSFGVGVNTLWANKWLDIEFGSTALTNLVVGANNGTADFPYLQRIRWASKSTSYTNLFEPFYYLSSVRQIIIDADMSNVTSMASMFYGCSALSYAPYMNTSNVTNMATMFGLCENLVSVPAYDTGKVTSFASTFLQCRKLKTVPVFNTANVTTFSNMFNGCSQLEEIPPVNVIKATDLTSMFRDCQNIKTITVSNVGNANTFATFARGCSALESASVTGALVNSGNVSCSSMFDQDFNLQNVTLFDTSRVINMNNMFTSCLNLRNAPVMNTANVTQASAMYQFCHSLSNIDATANFAKCTNFASMFEQCYMLTTAPNYNLANANTVAGMFISTRVNDLPAYNLANITSGGGGIITTGGGTAGGPPLVRSNVTNCRFTMTYVNCSLDKTELENTMSNMGNAISASQSFTITSNPGADTALSKTATWTNNSNVVTMANTVGVTVGCQLTGNQMANALAITVNSDNTITALSFIDNSTYIAFANVTTTNLVANTRYWVSNRTDVGSGNYTYQLSTSSGGNTISFTSGSANMLVNRVVTTVNTNSNVILSAYPSGNGTNATATTRVLNTNIVLFKGFTVTG